MNLQESNKYSVDKLKKLNVTGVGGLREIVVKNRIFKGISNLKKKQIIEGILSSEWWKTNGISAEIKEVEVKEENPKTLKECLTQRHKLRNEIRELEKKIKDRDVIETQTEENL
jgi:acid stress-induced BolA-like protein IbaG/YrbA